MSTSPLARPPSPMTAPEFRALLAGLRIPAVAAPMTGVSTPELVAQARIAGVLGSFPSSNAASSAELEEWFERIEADVNAAAGPGPIGPLVVNLIVGRQNTRLDDDVAAVARRRVPIVITSVGSPAPVIAPLHDAGCFVLADVASMAHAEKALAAGADGLVLLSAGAGGHTGWANPLAFVRAVRAVFDGPLAVAGGMSDGAALWAACCAGYDLGLFGTRFIATPASGAPAAWQGDLVTSTMDDIELGIAGNGVAASMLRSGNGSAGHSVSAVTAEIGVAELVDELVDDWERARARTVEQLAVTGTV
ncbi:MAG: NAD(P)H-dependent flavin oxidoreductase [Acidimicrobiales bacterium]